jgi:hypothetical protein
LPSAETAGFRSVNDYLDLRREEGWLEIDSFIYRRSPITPRLDGFIVRSFTFINSFQAPANPEAFFFILRPIAEYLKVLSLKKVRFEAESFLDILNQLHSLDTLMLEEVIFDRPIRTTELVEVIPALDSLSLIHSNVDGDGFIERRRAEEDGFHLNNLRSLVFISRVYIDRFIMPAGLEYLTTNRERFNITEDHFPTLKRLTYEQVEGKDISIPDWPNEVRVKGAHTVSMKRGTGPRPHQSLYLVGVERVNLNPLVFKHMESRPA